MVQLIYMDAAASTPIAPEAMVATAEAMRHTGNPSASHVAGRESATRVEAARAALAELLHAGPAGVTFLSSATEANNLVLRGLVRGGRRRAIVTTVAEHPSVLATVEDVTAGNGAAHFVTVSSDGVIDLEHLREVLDPETALVSVHAANNETGVIQPLESVVELAHEVGALVHADASQLMAWGANALLDDCDLVTVSSHKMYGPQGAAALIVRPPARGHLQPQITGGGQERGVRSGTVNVAAIAGFGAAAELALSSGRAAAEQVRALRTMLLNRLKIAVGDVIEHSAGVERRLPGILNVALGTDSPNSVESDALLARIPELAASTGSACHAGVPGPSPVLLAMGIPEWEAARSIRLSLSRYTTKDEVESAVSELGRAYGELRQLLEDSEMEELAL